MAIFPEYHIYDTSYLSFLYHISEDICNIYEQGIIFNYGNKRLITENTFFENKIR